MDDQRRVVMVETLTIDGGAAVGMPVPRARYQLDDHLGSSRVEVDGSGAILTYEEYHPYGTTAFRASSGATGFAPKRYRYNGKERDEETGLYYYGARYYPPWLARWTAVDPAGAGLNPYEYCFGSPIRFVDPDGRLPHDAHEDQAVYKAAESQKKGSGPAAVTDRAETQGKAALAGVGALLCAKVPLACSTGFGLGAVVASKDEKDVADAGLLVAATEGAGWFLGKLVEGGGKLLNKIAKTKAGAGSGVAPGPQTGGTGGTSKTPPAAPKEKIPVAASAQPPAAKAPGAEDPSKKPSAPKPGSPATGTPSVPKPAASAPVNEFTWINKEARENFVTAELHDGVLTTAIEAPEGVPGRVRGQDLWEMAVNAIGKDRIKAVRGYWVQGKRPGNLTTFNALMATGKYTHEEAARLTFTGIMAERMGFTKVEVVSVKVEGGKYTKVEVIFK